MSKKAFKNQASSGKVAFGPSGANLSSNTFGRTTGSILSYVYEPPDLSPISDAAVVVSFKNLQKKDSTTKTKALEELQTHVTSLGEDRDTLEDSFLDVWAKLFPRISIDNARRARQLAYGLHGRVVASAGKRFIKYIPSTIGAWLAGLQDGDKPVARSAQESFKNAFPNEDKQKGVWKAFHESILLYCSNAILSETTQTLSDERTVSPDDAEAKYSRAVGGAMLTTASTLEMLPEADVRKQEAIYKELLGSDVLWNLTSSKDPYIRKAIYRLILRAEDKLEQLFDTQAVGNYLIKALDADQTGSAMDFLQCITSLTRKEPAFWTTGYTGSSKKPPNKRLCHFLRRGSQGAGRDAWTLVEGLLLAIPQSVLLPEILPPTEGETQNTPVPSVLLALKEGIVRKTEARAQQESAWLCYLSVAQKILDCQDHDGFRTKLVQGNVLPLLLQHVQPNADRGEWSSDIGQHSVYERAAIVANIYAPRALEDMLQTISDSLIEDLRTSLPEQSKDFIKSQDSIVNKFNRWYVLRRDVFSSSAKDTTSILSRTSLAEVNTAIELLKSRNGKPYSAAAVLKQAAKLDVTLQRVMDGRQEVGSSEIQVTGVLVGFVKEQLPSYIGSPSTIYLFKLLSTLEDLMPLDDAWAKSIETLSAADSTPAKVATFQYLVSLPNWPKQPNVREALSRAVLTDLQSSLSLDDARWPLVDAAIRNAYAPETLKEEILTRMTKALSMTTENERAIEGLERVAFHDKALIQRHTSSPHGSELLSKLLYLSQEGDAQIQNRALRLKDVAAAAFTDNQVYDIDANPVLQILKEAILDTSDEALSVDSLVSQTLELTQNAPADRARDILVGILPGESRWADALQPFMDQTVDDALVLTNPLGGAAYLLDDPEHSTTIPSYDADGWSAPLRTALFLARVGAVAQFLDKVPSDRGLVQAFVALSIVAQLAGDNLSLAPRFPLFDRSICVDEKQIVDAVASVQAFHSQWLRSGAIESETWLATVLNTLYEGANRLDCTSYYHARAYTATVSALPESKQNAAILGYTEQNVSRISKGPGLLSDLALLGGACDSPIFARLAATKWLLNELLANLSALNFEDDPFEGLRKVTLLNLLLQNEMISLGEIPKQRIVFFAQHASGVLQGSISAAIESELLKSLAVLLPYIKDIYGEFWENVVGAVSEALESEESSLPLVHSSLRLSSLLSKVVKDDSNEDLQESWAEAKPKIASGLLSMLHAHADTPDSFNQPLKTVNSLLARQISAFADSTKLEANGVYPIMASESTTLQLCAYDILHKAIPQSQEQISLDAALTKDYVARLPEELLSLILEAPSADDYRDLHHAPEMPSTLARYLLSWKLLFDHWTSASYKVQANYVSSLKDSQSLSSLLSFTFSLLIDVRGKTPIDPTKLPSITSYTPSSPSYIDLTAETHALLCHLYYLALLHTPYLAKDWFTNSCPRALKSPVETWTEKYISHHVVAAELATVSAWTPPESTTTDSAASSEIKITTSPSTREVTGVLPIDEMFIGIRILLPPSYPLAPIAVSTCQRVGIDEKKWTAFLNVSRIVMNFSSTSQGLGCVIDGIAAWRSNVLSALRGQTECAICYSVVSEDRKVPDKKCATCNNRFHGVCLWKWFQRSGGSSCPLCRNAFNYA